VAGEGAVLTVRGEATLRVAPDVAMLTGSVVSTKKSTADAMAAAAAAQGRLTDDLSRLGAVPLTLDTERSALTWSAYSASSQPETKYNTQSHVHEETGRVITTVRVALAVRDLSRLRDLASVLARHESFRLHYVSWNVDEENPGWSAVRREAIQAAVRRARDYAEALGTSLATVEQVADAGLLEEATHPSSRNELMAFASAAAPARTESPDAPSLDPVPQEISAVVEARFRTAPITL
jgi:uncharacterized protein YggE